MSRRKGHIHTETFGSGPDVFMVHGWGMHSGVWRDFARRMACDFRITLADLPGHGLSGMIEDFTLEGVGQALLAVAPAKAHWLGWSLGAKISLHVAATNPSRCHSLVMLAGNARFAQGDDWPCAMDMDVLGRFAESMIVDYHKTLCQFLGLQTFGLENARALLKVLKERMAECDGPDERALRGGLEILRTVDLREALSGLQVPLQILLGARDRLAPPAAGELMQSLAQGAELHILDAAHTPFLSHPDECIHLLTDFWRRHGPAS